SLSDGFLAERGHKFLMIAERGESVAERAGRWWSSGLASDLVLSAWSLLELADAR
ncbi:hypothetical protein A2U01_0098589, partial [Trifolium medium]|nr:hypothetical protein [Trifolium medium]